MGDILYKDFAVEVSAVEVDGVLGGTMRITTSAEDRDGDTVHSSGAIISNYMAAGGPVLWGHNRSDPWAVIGRTEELVIGPDYIDAKFVLRPSTGPEDPMNIIRALWDGNWVNSASIGFRPVKWEEKEETWGIDFLEWELVEWSLVPVPANQEALRRSLGGIGGDVAKAALALVTDEPAITAEAVQERVAEYYRAKFDLAPWDATITCTLEREAVDVDPVKSNDGGESVTLEEKAGRKLSKANEEKIRKAVALLGDVLEGLGSDEDDAGAADIEDKGTDESAILDVVTDEGEGDIEHDDADATGNDDDNEQDPLDKSLAGLIPDDVLAQLTNWADTLTNHVREK